MFGFAGGRSRERPPASWLQKSYVGYPYELATEVFSVACHTQGRSSERPFRANARIQISARNTRHSFRKAQPAG